MDFDFHTLWRGFQSAVFYYVSCTPYFAFVARRKRQKQNARDRAERNALELVLPTSYRQPSPYRTNAYWAEEIRLGPHPPPRKSNKKQRAARIKAMAEAGNGSSGAAVEKGTPVVERGRTPVESSLELAIVDGVRGPLRPPESGLAETERWKLNQRHDEDLWGAAVYPGSAPSTAMVGPAKEPNTLAESFPALPGSTGRWVSKESFRPNGHPPVNDLHPAVVSNPAFSAGSNMWMLQPPPPAAIMQGYESPSNSRSRSTTASSGSRSSRRGGSSTAASSMLGRKLSQRLVEEKLRRGEMLYPNDLRRVPSSWSANTDALRIEAKYFEDPVSRKKNQDKLSDLSSETVVRSNENGQASLVDANASIGKADSGVELKGLPSSKENVAKNGTLRQDFAFPRELLRQNNALFAKDRSNSFDPSSKMGTIPRSSQSHRLSSAATAAAISQKQTKSMPKRLPLSRILSTSSATAASGDHSAEQDISTSHDSLGTDLDLDDDADDEGDEDEDIALSKTPSPRRGKKPSGRPISKFKGRLALQVTPQPLHQEFVQNRRWSVDF